MGESSAHFRGVVRNGVIVPEDGVSLPEGTEVEFNVRTLEFTPEERAEFEAWNRLSEKAWKWIDDLEATEPPDATG